MPESSTSRRTPDLDARVGAPPQRDFLVYIVHVIDSQHTWAEIETGQALGLVVTADGGRHWTRVPVPPSAMML
jgi:photosystem II stability/assembly factor-like uncharacterized protein